jgi:hypothetical protein
MRPSLRWPRSLVQVLELAPSLAALGCATSPPPASRVHEPSNSPSADVAHADARLECAQISAHLTNLSRAGAYELRSEDERAWFEDFLAKQAARLAEECTARPWSTSYRRCLAGATDSTLRACDRADRVARGHDLGGASCDEVGAHFAAIVATEPPPPPHDDNRPVSPAQIARNAEAMSLVCDSAGWTRTVKACLLLATTGDELVACQSR